MSPAKKPRRTSKKPGTADLPQAPPDTFDAARAISQPEPILVYGPDGRILYVNPAMERAMEYPAGAMVGTALIAYVPEPLQLTVQNGLVARDRSGALPPSEIALVTSSGLVRSLILKARPVRFGNRPATLLFLIDITGRKALEDQLTARAEELLQISTAYKQANRKLALLSSITRHDISNQLTVLKGYLGLVESEQTDPDLAEYCKKASTAASRIHAMIRFTSEYDKVGITAPSWQDCRATIDEAAAQAPLGAIVLRNEIPAGHEIFADPLIVKVFYNLMDNAVRYGGKITTIRFFPEEQNGFLIIVCEDDGDGVAAAEKGRIFERGFGKNTGLGLALSREILDITGITIRENGTPGAGARFEIAVLPGGFRRSGPQ